MFGRKGKQVGDYDQFQCNACGTKSCERIVAEGTIDHSEYVLEYGEERPIFIAQQTLRVMVCSNCNTPTLQSRMWDQQYEHGEKHHPFTTLYPKQSKISGEMPKNIKSAYSTAMKVKSVDVNAFAVLLGRVLEIVCVDQGAKGSSLSAKLEDLSHKAGFSQDLKDVCSGIRDLRNIGAHATLGELTRSEAPLLERLCNAILENLYVAPQLASEAKQQLQKLREKQAEKLGRRVEEN